jgi:CelD/BcsL family acetyltransferase involved in cellulose biosynthesis
MSRGKNVGIVDRSVTVKRPGELGPEEARAWVALQSQAESTYSPFFSLTFVHAVGRARASARVAIVHEAGRIASFLPFELGSRRIGRPIGWPMNDLHGLIGAPQVSDISWIVRQARLRGWRFEHAPADQVALAAHHYERSAVQCPVIDLESGYDAFYRGRARTLVKRTAEKRRALAREAGPVELLWQAEDAALVKLLIDWKSSKYGGSRKIFSDPAAVQIVSELAAEKAADCTAVMSALLAGGKPVALHLGLSGPDGLAYWLPAYDPDFGRYSPGLIMLFELAEDAASRGVKRIDLGYGQHEYKFKLATDSYPVAAGAVWAIPGERTARRMYRFVHRAIDSRLPIPRSLNVGSARRGSTTTHP